MVKVNIKNIINYFDNEQNNNTNLIINIIINKINTDPDFNKFMSLVLKYNLLIFEKKELLWIIKDKNIINFQIDKNIKNTYNDHIINITQLSSMDSDNFNEVRLLLDKLNLNLKKKISDFYDLKILLKIINLSINQIDPINNLIITQIESINNLQKNYLDKPKRKKIINNDIYIEEFSN
mgnify:CR=1 FL=1